MKFEIKYSMQIDLIFHVLAYLKVDNTSNCYNEKYIDYMAKKKRNFDYDIIPSIIKLQGYYNENFERLSMINFLPFYSNTFEEMKNIFLNYKNFTYNDIKYFIEPFIKVLDNESDFYFSYWNVLHKNNEVRRLSFEKVLNSKFEKYFCVFDYFKKNALAFLSYSIGHNGRGFSGIDSYFSCIASFPVNDECINYTFFTLLHEFTHQYTDDLLNRNINMQDGSHNDSENIVILADYYLIKIIDENEIISYFKWLEYLAKKNGLEDSTLSESIFFSIFNIDEKIEIEIKNLIKNIVERFNY